MAKRKLISFDWAMKRVLRSKANFGVLEGFLSELLNKNVKIIEILESESNKESEESKFNRIDLKAKLSGKEIVIVEIQNNNEYDFFQRILYSASKTVCEHIDKSEAYAKVVKVISVNIIHFKLGDGDDYVYRGFTDFKGIHTDTPLKLNPKQVKLFNKILPGDLMPEYYILEVKGFNDVAKTPLDEWIYFLKNGEIEENFTAKGLKKAQEALDVLKLTPDETLAYDNFIDWRRRSLSRYVTSQMEGFDRGFAKGRAEGRAEGEAKGKEKEQLNIAKRMLEKGFSVSDVAALTGLEEDQIKSLAESFHT